jgi:hypothetical protein
MFPADGEVLHFSEDPAITEFVPHVAATARQPEAYVWAVDRSRAPDYWFPRRCPRVLAWVVDGATAADRALLAGADRVHVIERSWLPAMRTTALFAYRLPAAPFRPFGEHRHAVVATGIVRPLGPPEPVGDLVAAHEVAGVELRVADDLAPYVAAWHPTTLGFSAIRLPR